MGGRGLACETKYRVVARKCIIVGGASCPAYWLAKTSSSGWNNHTTISLGYPDLFRIPKGKVWALSCANRLTLECRNLTADLC